MIFFSESGEKNHKNYELTIFCVFVLTKPQNVVYNDYTTKNTATRNTEEKRKMKVIKRNGAEMQFDIEKIVAAITKANEASEQDVRLTPMQIRRIAEAVELNCIRMNRAPGVEEIQDLVEKQIMAHGAYEVAKKYITYRYTRNLIRRSNTTDDRILSLIECHNEEAKQENANKNPTVNSVQRDYMAGEVSRDITNRILLPEDTVKAHAEGIINFHNTDYYTQHKQN